MSIVKPCTPDIKPIVFQAAKTSLMKRMSEPEQMYQEKSKADEDSDNLDQPPSARRTLDDVVISRLPTVKVRPLVFTLDTIDENVAEPDQQAKPGLLVIEKGVAIKKLARTLCQPLDIDVYKANSCAQAVKVLSMGMAIGIAVVDVSCDLEETLEVLSAFKRCWPDLCVIGLANSDDLKAAMKLVNEGQVFRYLQKPVDPIQFESTIVAGIKRHEMLKKMEVFDENFLKPDSELSSRSGMQKLKRLLKSSA